MLCSNRRSSSAESIPEALAAQRGPGALVTPSRGRLHRARAFFQDYKGRPFNNSEPRRCSDITLLHLGRIFQEISDHCGQPMDRDKIQHMQILLTRCTKGDAILDAVDKNGWNLLQAAIVGNQPHLVNVLLDKKVDINNGICTLPLHLACKLGHAQIVQLLLDYGAKPDIQIGVCYPISHIVKSSSAGQPQNASRQGTKWSRCHEHKYPLLAFQLAMSHDRVEVLKVMLSHKSSKDMIKRDQLLHDACKYRAKRCLKYLVDVMPELVNVRDKKGHTPLQYVLQNIKHRESAMILLESSANFSEDSFETENGTLLHELYVSDDTSNFVRLTELMLRKGPPNLAKKLRKPDGDTLLNTLLKNFFGPNNIQHKENYVESIKECMLILIDAGCDPKKANDKGETALHSLLTHHNARPLFYLRDRLSVSGNYLSNIFNGICTLLEVLFEHLESADLMEPPTMVSPLFYLMRIVCTMSPPLLCITEEKVKTCVIQLCAHGANPNSINASDDNTISLLVGTLSRWLYLINDDRDLLETLLEFTYEMLQIFLLYNLDPQKVLQKNLKQFAIIFNLPAIDTRFIWHINELLRALVRAGGNPNLIHMGDYSVNGQSAYVTKYTVGYYIARGLYIHGLAKNDAVFNLFAVFQNTLTQTSLNRWIECLCTNLEVEFAHGEPNTHIQNSIKALSAEPMSLKKRSRIAIYDAIDWKIQKCSQLPLPQILINYLVELEVQ